MAEGLFRDLVEKNDADFAVKSAGVGAQDGQPPSENSVRAMQDLGIDITSQRSKMLTAELAAEADMIIGMTQGHVEMVNLMYPQAADKTFMLREFDESPPSMNARSPIRSAAPTRFTAFAGTKFGKESTHC